ncbi:nucleotide exchange factor GrpE [Paenibacillaceae bacterium WGS1546]|uniref:nucleotide exchange factor GrpE n=1 Tax=Cohnella sp. WGS1546 TaxID=3366810 RepID=UPI00372D5429
MSTNDTKEQEVMEEQRQDEAVEETGTATETEAASAPNGEQPAAEEADVDPRIAELQRLADDHHNRYLRAQADFDNFRRRTTKEKEELAQYASMKLITELLPVLDNFERALQSGGEAADTASFAKGVDMIYRQLVQVLEAEGLKAMEVVGQPFDPELHQAIMRVESDEHEEGTITEAVQTGYTLKDKVIRPAMVKVTG